MSNIIKKMSVGAWIYLGVFLFGFVALIIYAANGAIEGYFKGSNNGVVVALTIIALLCVAGAIILPFFAFKDPINDVIKMVVALLKVAGPMLLVVSFMMFIASRAEGLAYIFFSEANVLAEIQTPANMASARGTIFGIIFYVIAWLASVVAPFFAIVKE